MPSLTPLDLPSTSARPAALGPTGRRIRPFSLVGLLIALVLLLVATPLLQDLPGGNLAESLLLSLVLLLGVLAVGVRRRTLAVGIILVVPALVARWVHHYSPALMPREAVVLAGAVFIVFVISHLLGFILRAPHVDAEVLCAGIATYFLLGLVWALAYVLVADLDPNAFAFTVGPASDHVLDRFNGLYFSFVTLSTVGFGDIVPISRMARMLAIMEATTGTFYITILIARLVALHSSATADVDASSGSQP